MLVERRRRDVAFAWKPRFVCVRGADSATHSAHYSPRSVAEWERDILMSE